MWSYMHCPAPALCPRCSKLAVTFVNPYTYQMELDQLNRTEAQLQSSCQPSSSKEISEQRRNSSASTCSSNSSTSSTSSSSSDDTSSASTQSSVCIEYNLITPPRLLPLTKSYTL